MFYRFGLWRNSTSAWHDDVDNSMNQVQRGRMAAETPWRQTIHWMPRLVPGAKWTNCFGTKPPRWGVKQAPAHAFRDGVENPSKDLEGEYRLNPIPRNSRQGLFQKHFKKRSETMQKKKKLEIAQNNTNWMLECSKKRHRVWLGLWLWQEVWGFCWNCPTSAQTMCRVRSKEYAVSW